MNAHMQPPDLLTIQSIDLGEPQRRELLRIARDAIRAYLLTGETPTYATADPALMQPAGLFVTLWQWGEDTAVSSRPGARLRGCIGHIQADTALVEITPLMAVKAAAADPRFPPLQIAELDDTVIEISILSPLTPVADLAQIAIGVHGLVIANDWRRGLLLPQVPGPRGWDAAQFLLAVCHKAGLPPDAWPEQADLYAFTTTVFDETELPRD